MRAATSRSVRGARAATVWLADANVVAMFVRTRPMSDEFVIYADESEEVGTYYSDFYGGALVRSQDLRPVVDCLEAKKKSLNFHGEVKWNKVSERYLGKYIELMDSFFDLIANDQVKIRIMFTQTRHVALGLSAYHKRNKYQLLYYQFIKHGFGLAHLTRAKNPVSLRVMLDDLPCNREKAAEFKKYIADLGESREFIRAGVQVPKEQIAEVCSHDHVVLQCLDIVLGSMQFRLNDKHLEKMPGSRFRGKKTVAKHKLYKHINARLQLMRKGFNIGATTGSNHGPVSRWQHPYRHWLFTPAKSNIDDSRTKGRRKRKAPPAAIP
ncbi:MAG: hypothetical protein JWN04_4041 [Myxococcaceae bacterium]|nr:hypothetical protein [Myxococcaceae bacterium]